MRIFSLLLFSCLFFACNSPIVELPPITPRLVLNGLALTEIPQSDTTGIGVKLNLSSSVVDDRAFYDPFYNASVSVRLFENNQLLETVTDAIVNDGNALYFFDKAIAMPGNTYRVEASSDQFATAMAGYVQPLPVHIDSLSVTVLGPNNDPEFDGTEVLIRVYINDPPEANFYFLSARMQADDSRISCCTRNLSLKFLDPYYASEAMSYDERTGAQSLSFTDLKFDGQRKYFDLKSNYGTPQPGSTDFPFYVLTLTTVTQEYYEYLKDAILQATVRDDPFGQPVYINGNVVNGLGMFTGTTQTRKILKVDN